jgi:hypothetical protein
MGFNPEELDEHCQQILNDRRILNKVVILCEGEIRDIQGRRSPQAYRNLEKMPDANFYKKCVPKTWNNKPRPQFFNCGDRNSVIDTYFRLLILSQKQTSYLNSQKLYVLVDLDLQAKKIENYHFTDLESIFYSLYKKAKIIQNLVEHRIWVTRFIHKEAYFITPNIQEVFNNSILAPRYNNASVLLKDIYLKICDDITQDIDLQDNFAKAIARIQDYSYLECDEVATLQKSWHKEFSRCIDEQRKKELVDALLTIIKAKKYWNEIKPNSEWRKSTEIFREQLSLEIGNFYSKQDWNDSKNYLSFFFRYLYSRS